MREITKEQFSTDSTIDGRRIDKAVEDIVDRANAIEKRDMKRRFFQTQIVGAYVPSVGVVGGPVTPTTTEDGLPFMSEINPDTTTDPADNKFRVKGTHRSHQTNGAPTSFISTAAFIFKSPVVIVGVSVVLATDAQYPNNFEYAASAGTDLNKYGDSDDFTVSMSVDNPFLPENRALNSEVYHRFAFKIKSQSFRRVAATPTVDMLPLMQNASTTYHLGGAIIDDQSLNIPVPRNSRVRFSLAIPDYTVEPSDMSGWGTIDGDFANNRPWESQVISWTLTILEGAEE